jgi:hypothetical protein
VSGIRAKRAYLFYSTPEKPRSWRPLDHIIGVGEQAGRNHEVSHPDQKRLKTYESFFWLTSSQVLETEEFAKRPTGRQKHRSRY